MVLVWFCGFFLLGGRHVTFCGGGVGPVRPPYHIESFAFPCRRERLHALMWSLTLIHSPSVKLPASRPCSHLDLFPISKDLFSREGKEPDKAFYKQYRGFFLNRKRVVSRCHHRTSPT